jgi:hypothetical protein
MLTYVFRCSDCQDTCDVTEIPVTEHYEFWGQVGIETTYEVLSNCCGKDADMVVEEYNEQSNT